MGRAASWNWEIHSGETVIRPSSIGEFGEGEEGRIEVADGDRKYKIRDQIYAVDEIEVVILLRQNNRDEYDFMKKWALSGETKNVFLVAVGAGRTNVASGSTKAGGRDQTMKFLLGNCECAMGRIGAFDRQSKEFGKRKFFLIPDDIEEQVL